MRLRITLRKAYQTIDDLPIYNWLKIAETNNFKWLVIRGKYTKEELEWIYELLMEEFIKTFGVSKQFKKLFNQKKKIAQLEAKYAITRKEHLKFKLKIEKEKLKDLDPVKVEKENFFNVIKEVEKHTKRTLDEKSISVRKFYTYLNDLKNA